MAILPDVPDTCVPSGFRERVLARAILRAYECDHLAWHHWRGESAHPKMPRYNISLPLRLPFLRPGAHSSGPQVVARYLLATDREMELRSNLHRGTSHLGKGLCSKPILRTQPLSADCLDTDLHTVQRDRGWVSQMKFDPMIPCDLVRHPPVACSKASLPGRSCRRVCEPSIDRRCSANGCGG